MTRQETVDLVTLIVAAYPAADRLKDRDTIKAMVNVWEKIFKDDNQNLVRLAVEKHVATNKWPPNIAEIREQMALIEHPELVPPDVAWIVVSDLLYAERDYSSNPTKELPPLIARCVDAIGWSHLKELHRGYIGGRKPGMDRLAFMQQYTPMYERMRERVMLPKALYETVLNAEQKLGGETYRMIEATYQKRLAKEEEFNNFVGDLDLGELSTAEEAKLLESGLDT